MSCEYWWCGWEWGGIERVCGEWGDQLIVCVLHDLVERSEYSVVWHTTGQWVNRSAVDGVLVTLRVLGVCFCLCLCVCVWEAGVHMSLLILRHCPCYSDWDNTHYIEYGRSLCLCYVPSMGVWLCFCLFVWSTLLLLGYSEGYSKHHITIPAVVLSASL